MINNKTIKIITLLLIILAGYSFAQSQPWKKGILVDEFVYETAPFPQSHSATIAETPAGLVTAFFGGTKERNPDVCIWVSRHVNGKWTAPQNVADGIMPDKRYPTWNPVLYQIPNGELMLFYKIGASPGTWHGWLRTSKDNGITWSDARKLPEGYLGPVKTKPILVLTPSSQVYWIMVMGNFRSWHAVVTGPSCNHGHMIMAKHGLRFLKLICQIITQVQML